MINTPHGGESIIIRNKKKAILYECGEGHDDVNEKLAKKIRNHLKYKAKLQAIVLSHNHEDHGNAIGSLLSGNNSQLLRKDFKFYHQGEERPKTKFYTKMKKVIWGKHTNISIGPWEKKSIKKWDGNKSIKLFCGPRIKNKNRLYRSILMSVPFGDAKFLFTGDILERSTTRKTKPKKSTVKKYGNYTELQLISNDNTKHLLRNIDVLNITHHGSHTGTSTEFLDHTSPALFITSSAKDGRHNLSSETECRINDYIDRNGTNFDVPYYTIFNTHWEKNIVIRTDGKKRTMDGAQGIFFEVETEK